MAKINLVLIALLIVTLLADGSALVIIIRQHQIIAALSNYAAAERGVSYSCGFLQGQRAWAPIGIALPDAPNFCAEHRQNAKQHGFTEGKNP